MKKRYLFMVLVFFPFAGMGQSVEEVTSSTGDIRPLNPATDANGDQINDFYLEVHTGENFCVELKIISGVDGTELASLSSSSFLEGQLNINDLCDDEYNPLHYLGLANSKLFFLKKGKVFYTDPDGGNATSLFEEDFDGDDFVTDLDNDGFYESFGDYISEKGNKWFRIIGITLTDSETEKTSSKVVQLNQNYPNPFNPSTKISYKLEQTGEVTLKVYDISGRLIATLIEGKMMPGSYSYDFDGFGLASGTYIYELITPSGNQTKKMTLIK